MLYISLSFKKNWFIFLKVDYLWLKKTHLYIILYYIYIYIYIIILYYIILYYIILYYNYIIIILYYIILYYYILYYIIYYITYNINRRSLIGWGAIFFMKINCDIYCFFLLFTSFKNRTWKTSTLPSSAFSVLRGNYLRALNITTYCLQF